MTLQKSPKSGGMSLQTGIEPSGTEFEERFATFSNSFC
jgi:hypothetical protein